MRITGGKAKGIRLKTPNGTNTRPATDQMREAVFSSLGSQLEDARVADLFAGTGAYGLEALSRGAAAVHFYENDRAALACLRENLAAVLHSAQRSPAGTKIELRDVYSLDTPPMPYDWIFIDPPYASLESKLDALFGGCLFRLSGTHTHVVLELPGELQPRPQGWEIIRRLGKVRKNKPTAAIFKRVLNR